MKNSYKNGWSEEEPPKEMNYDSVTIENIENAIKTGYITGFECDGDNKVLIVSEDNCKRIENAFKQIADIAYTVCEEIKNIFIKTFCNLTSVLSKKITKKRFIKLLQSEGVQRNTINKIIKNNKEEYTYSRYLDTLKKLEGRSTYDR